VLTCFSKKDPHPHTDSRGRVPLGVPQAVRWKPASPDSRSLAASTSSSSWEPLQQSGLEAAHQLGELVLISVAMRV
jgi:hypothetical protein